MLLRPGPLKNVLHRWCHAAASFAVTGSAWSSRSAPSASSGGKLSGVAFSFHRTSASMNSVENSGCPACSALACSVLENPTCTPKCPAHYFKHGLALVSMLSLCLWTKSLTATAWAQRSGWSFLSGLLRCLRHVAWANVCMRLSSDLVCRAHGPPAPTPPLLCPGSWQAGQLPLAAGSHSPGGTHE